MGRTHLIYSNKCNRKHRRLLNGGACGYTSDILEPGGKPSKPSASISRRSTRKMDYEHLD